ncbi:MAG: enhanced intracellular survival protein Eis [Candidatus Hodarchaeota archaeon]
MVSPSKMEHMPMREDLGIELRQLGDEDRETFARMMRYAFSSTKNTYEDALEENWKETQPFLKDMSQCYGCFEKGTLVSVSAFFESTLVVRKKEFPFGGIWGVATSPNYRNRGLIRQLFDKMLEEMYLRKIPFSVLYPFKFSYYEQFGFKLANEIFRYHIELKDIISRPIDNRIVREVFSLEDIKRVYEKITREFYNYMVKRTDDDWRRRINPKEPGYFFICYDEDETPKGYMVVRFQERGDPDFQESEQTIYLAEIFWVDRETRQALFNFLKAHADHRKYVLFGSPDHDIMSYVSNPRVKQTDIFAGSMIRIIDVETVLQAFSYPNIGDESLILQIQDPNCKWNEKSISLCLENEKVTISETSQPADVKVEIGALSQMVVGYRTASQLHNSWDIECSQDMLAMLDQLFPRQNNFMRDFF